MQTHRWDCRESLQSTSKTGRGDKVTGADHNVASGSSLPVLNLASHWTGVYFPGKREASSSELDFCSGHACSGVPTWSPGR